MDFWEVYPFLFRRSKGESDYSAAPPTKPAHILKAFKLVLEPRGKEVNVCYIRTRIYCCVFNCDGYGAKLCWGQNLWLDGIVSDRKRGRLGAGNGGGKCQ